MTKHKQRTCKVTLRRICATIAAVKSSITYSEGVFVALGIQHAIRTRRISLSPVACPDLQYFSTSSHKRHIFLKKKVTEQNMCVLIPSTTFVWNIFHSKKN
jgi:hypothetical protein